MIRLITVHPPHVYIDHIDRFLYSLLKEREPHQSISHKVMPTYTNHKRFVKSKPYKQWYLILENIYNSPVGSIYISNNNEIGLFISKKQRGKGYGSAALDKLLELHPERPVYANINPENNDSVMFFMDNEFIWEKEIPGVQDVYVRS